MKTALAVFLIVFILCFSCAGDKTGENVAEIGVDFVWDIKNHQRSPEIHLENVPVGADRLQIQFFDATAEYEHGGGSLQISSDNVLSFLNRQTEGNKACPKRIRYAQLSAFFNFIRNNIDHESANPYDTPMIRKLCMERVVSRWKITGKETVDEIIFRTTKIRNRLILELMARGGMRIGEVLKLKMGDIHDRKLILHEPKSGKQHEIVFIPQKVAERLREYAMQVCERSEGRIFQSPNLKSQIVTSSLDCK